jgi:hypothetical protein
MAYTPIIIIITELSEALATSCWKIMGSILDWNTDYNGRFFIVTKPQSFQVNVRIAASNMTLSQSFQPSEA